jgi:uncharacterized protein (TIGR03437 family)
VGNTQVLINSRFAPLYYVDSTQINAQVPWEVNGANYLAVQVLVNGLASNLATVSLTASAPGILAIAHAADGSVVSPARPAARGEYLTVYAVGLGPVTNPPATGAAALAKPLSTTTSVPSLTIGGVAANVTFSGLTPGFSGLYQVNVQVPSESPGGNDVVVLNSGGLISNVVAVSVASDLISDVQVTVAPISASLNPAGTQQFSATMDGPAGQAFLWSVNGVPGGNTAIGTISQNGLYTAPVTPPAGNIVVIAAASPADSTVAGTAVIVLTTPSTTSSTLGRFRSKAPGLRGQFDRRGYPSEYVNGQLIQLFSQFDSVVGSTVGDEISLQLDKIHQMGVTTVTIEWRTADPGAGAVPFVPPTCFENSALGPQWPQPTSTEIASMKRLFDLFADRNMRVQLGLVNTHMEEQPPSNSATWIGAILGAIGQHPALDLITFDGTPHLVLSSPNGVPDTCGIPAEASLWQGPDDTASKYIQWAIGYAQSLGVPARKLSAEAIVGNILTDSQSPNCCSTDGHFWNPVTTLKTIFDRVAVPDNQRTYALSFYEHSKCATAGSFPCDSNIEPHAWAEQTLQNAYAITGVGGGSRIYATEMGHDPALDSRKTEWVLESQIQLFDKYAIDGGAFWRWANDSTSQDGNPAFADAVKRRGVDFIYNPVQKEVLDWTGFHLSAIPNGSFEEDLDANGAPTHWAITGKGSGSAYYLPQESGQPQVPSRGSYSLRLTSTDSATAISATSDRIPVTPGTAYTTAANLRFAWTGDPNPSAGAPTRPQVFVTVHYYNAAGQPASTPSGTFRYFQENGAPSFQTFIWQYTTPSDARTVQLEVGASRNGLIAPIVLDVDNLR